MGVGRGSCNSFAILHAKIFLQGLFFVPNFTGNLTQVCLLGLLGAAPARPGPKLALLPFQMSKSGSPCPGGRWAPAPLPRSQLRPWLSESTISGKTSLLFSSPSPGSGSNFALRTLGNSKRHWQLQSSLYQRQLWGVAPSRL